MQDHDPMDDEFELEPEEIEAYCVHCKQTVVMEHPNPVWTRRGAPGTRGECPICANTIFRMGRTEAHNGLQRPEMGQLMGGVAKPGRKTSVATRYAAYINFSPADQTLAARIAEDLSKSGIPTWYPSDPAENGDEHWASGVHPALVECSHMVVVLSGDALKADQVQQGWMYFREQRKPVVVAQAGPCDVPDDLRTRPRFDFGGDYKQAFREMVQALAG
jgi:hypothetical protein